MGSIVDDLHTFISVDIEAAGPIPSQYALLSIGACTLTQPRRTFYAELIPDKDQTDPHSLEVHGLDLARLAREGLRQKKRCVRFAAWLAEVVPPGRKPLMVGFNLPFDWMFINDYFLPLPGKQSVWAQRGGHQGSLSGRQR